MTLRKKALHIFRRDLRLPDNTALRLAAVEAREVIPAFILDPVQLSPHRYFSSNALQFMLASLIELDEELRGHGGRLYLFRGSPRDIVERLIVEEGVDAVYVNRDYTPYSQQRDRALYELCLERGVHWHACHDLLLNPPKKIVKSDGSPYTVYTPFYKRAIKEIVDRPAPEPRGVYATDAAAGEEPHQLLHELLPIKNPSLFRKGGRREGVRILNQLGRLVGYNEERDFPAKEGCSGLSPHHKFGTLSIREVYAKAKASLPADSRFIPELYWRDFFTQIGYHFPHVFSGAFHKRFDNLVWDDDAEKFQAWCEGMTGFPLVDAGMRELNRTGFMHNRVRMVTASFLTKDLHISWREGERYFASKLVDYDPAVNNGSWQWSASTGCDAQPYFRIFNPWLQQARFDPAGDYIRRWVPELSSLSPKALHTLAEHTPPRGYPTPIVDHAIEKIRAEEMFGEMGK